jgi:site-specific DNA recombinase
LAGDRRDEAIAAMVKAQAPEDAVDSVGAALRAQIAACDAKITRYKATLDAGADPAVVAGWITTTRADRAGGAGSAPAG